MIRVFIKRKVSDIQVVELMELLKKLRALTLSQTGYISGETLKRMDKEGECMVISSWSSMDDWNDWLNNEERKAVQAEIDELLGEKTKYEVYG